VRAITRSTPQVESARASITRRAAGYPQAIRPVPAVLGCIESALEELLDVAAAADLAVEAPSGFVYLSSRLTRKPCH
jgi:hypothetical protein